MNRVMYKIEKTEAGHENIFKSVLGLKGGQDEK